MKKLKLITSIAGLSTLAAACCGLTTSCGTTASSSDIKDIYVKVVNEKKEIGSVFTESDIQVMVTDSNDKITEVKYDSTGTNGYTIKGTMIGEILSGSVGETKNFTVIYKTRVANNHFVLKEKEQPGPIVGDQFVVEFVTGCEIHVDSQLIKKGEKATKPTCDRPLYDLIGWYTDEQCSEGNEFDFDTPITATTKLYAKWNYKETSDEYFEFELINGDTEYAVSAKYNTILPDYTKIPSTHEGKPVTAIARGGFYNNIFISKIEIPSSIKTIEPAAFNYCQRLQTVILNEGLQTIGTYAFANTPIKEITIPKTVVEISVGEYDGTIGEAFESCTMLEKVVIENNSQLTTLGDGTFYQCIKLAEINLENATKLQKIPYKTFYSTSLKEVTIPAGVKFIGQQAFRTGQNEISTLEKVKFEDNSKLEKIDTDAFDSQTKMELENIPSSIKVIGSEAFVNCKKLTSFAFGENLTKICSGAFSGSGLTSLDFSNCKSLEEIEYQAFADCPITGEVQLPDCLLKIGENAFNAETATTQITKITFGSNISYIGNQIVSSDVGSIILPNKSNWHNEDDSNILDLPDDTKVKQVLTEDENNILRDNKPDGLLIEKVGSYNIYNVCWDKNSAQTTITIPKKFNMNGVECSIGQITTIDGQNGFAGAELDELIINSPTITEFPTGSFREANIGSLKINVPLCEIKAGAFEMYETQEDNKVKFAKPDVWTLTDTRFPTSTDEFDPAKYDENETAQALVDNVDSDWRVNSTLDYIEATPTSATTCSVTRSPMFNGDETFVYVVIPEKINIDGVDYTVTNIAEKAFHFYQKNTPTLRKVRIPKTVETIGKQAFQSQPKAGRIHDFECEIAHDSVLTKIGTNCFADTFMRNTNFYIPKKLIDSTSFNALSSLVKNLEFDADWEGEEIPYRSNQIYIYGELNIPKNVKKINRFANYSNCQGVTFDDTTHTWTSNGDTLDPASASATEILQFMKNHQNNTITRND